MKKFTQAADDNGIPLKLIRNVAHQIGDKELLEDVARHGADAGYPGFTYYSDTVAFFKRNRKEIVELVMRMADDMGEPAAEMVAAFNCLAGRSLKPGMQDHKRHRQLQEYLPSVYRCLGGGRLTDEDDIVANALAWFAAEEVARACCDE